MGFQRVAGDALGILTESDACMHTVEPHNKRDIWDQPYCVSSREVALSSGVKSTTIIGKGPSNYVRLREVFLLCPLLG